MKVGVLGSGMVGQAIGAKLIELGHDVVVGTRDPGKLQEWLGKVGGKARAGSFADAAAHGEIVFNCTAGTSTWATSPRRAAWRCTCRSGFACGAPCRRPCSTSRS